jgi:hypothetical protein
VSPVRLAHFNKKVFMNKRVIDFFKRNADAKGCHLVLREVFPYGEREAAGAYAKSKNAVVTSVSREEYDKWVKAQKGKVKSENAEAAEANEPAK